MATPLNRYKADLRDFRFVLFEHLGLGSILGKAPYAEWGEDECNMVLDEVYRFACEVSGPYNQIGDQEGCQVVDGRVQTPQGFKQAWEKLWEAGWRTISVAEDLGGQGAPVAMGAIVEELLCGSNLAFSMYPGLTLGAAEMTAHFGTERQRKLYALPMMAGRFCGTMCLTEPHAGSDVGSATTSATRNEDGTYNIKGTKIFISGGDSDFNENTVHLVLARIEGAEKGTKGLSLFIVPRVRVNEDGSLGEDNDLEVASIEHKMGINGSATCVLQFGDNDGCRGELVGNVEHQGMRQMFRMMNFARISVGIQGLSVASNAYLNAVEYAKERKQGSSIENFKDPHSPRVPIIEHPNIRRDLLSMKARVEGARALFLKLAMHQDHVLIIGGKDDESSAYHHGQVELLTPLVKAYGSDEGFQICADAMQIYGGAGYLKDHPVEQACRDAKITSIYEGTTYIQAMDLVARKLGQGGGANTKAFFADIQKFVDAHQHDSEFGAAVAHLHKAQQAVGACVMQLLGWSQGGEMKRIPLAAEPFLKIMSELAVGWLLLEQAAIAIEKLPGVAESHPDRAFYAGKKYGALHFANTVLAAIPSEAKLLMEVDESALHVPEDAFASG